MNRSYFSAITLAVAALAAGNAMAADASAAKTREQVKAELAEAIRTGDLIVFSKGNESTHAGIYVGDGRFVHAPSTGGRVRLDRYNSSYWANYKIAFNRP